MKLIQPVLVLLFLVLAWGYFSSFRSRLLDRVVVFIFLVSAISVVAIPDLSNQIAHMMGVGRGADLVTYLGLSGLLFLWLVLYGRVREVREQVTQLARIMALEGARRDQDRSPEEGTPPDSHEAASS